MCTTAENCKKTLKSPTVQGSRSLKIIDVDTIQKLVTSVDYDKQHVCATVFTLVELIAVK